LKTRPTGKGKTWGYLSSVFAILDLRTAELGINKIPSHLKEIVEEAIAAGAATVCDIIGNALADEAAAIAAKWFRPQQTETREATLLNKQAFLICIRLACTQARLWELTADALMYEAPPELEEVDLDPSSVFQRTADDFASTGHDLEPATQGKQSGHRCTRCPAFHAKHNFNKWLTGKPCRPKATGLERKAAFEQEFNQKAKEARVARETFTIFDTDSEDDLERTPAAVRPEPKKATKVDQSEAEELNEESKAKQDNESKSQTGGGKRWTYENRQEISQHKSSKQVVVKVAIDPELQETFEVHKNPKQQSGQQDKPEAGK